MRLVRHLRKASIIVFYTLNRFLKIGGHQNGRWQDRVQREHSRLLKQAVLVAFKKTLNTEEEGGSVTMEINSRFLNGYCNFDELRVQMQLSFVLFSKDKMPLWKNCNTLLFAMSLQANSCEGNKSATNSSSQHCKIKAYNLTG